MPILPLNTTSSRNVYLDAARGLRPDMRTVHIFGFNRTIATAYETVWNNGGGIYTFPAAADTLDLVSSSESDTMGVLIEGLDANYQQISEVVTLNGTSSVETTKSFLRINSARIVSGNNVGNITIGDGSTNFAYIEATYGIQQAALFTVPAGFTFYITQVDFTSGTLTGNKYLTARACANFNEGPELHFFETTFVTSQLKYDLQVPYAVPEKTDFSFEAKSSAQTNELTIYVGGVLLEN